MSASSPAAEVSPRRKRRVSGDTENPETCFSCGEKTTFGKPYCIDHLVNGGYAQKVARMVEDRSSEIESALCRRPSIPLDGYLARDIIMTLALRGSLTPKRLSVILEVTPQVIEGCLVVLANADLLLNMTLGSRRGTPRRVAALADTGKKMAATWLSVPSATISSEDGEPAMPEETSETPAVAAPEAMPPSAAATSPAPEPSAPPTPPATAPPATAPPTPPEPPADTAERPTPAPVVELPVPVVEPPLPPAAAADPTPPTTALAKTSPPTPVHAIRMPAGALTTGAGLRDAEWAFIRATLDEVGWNKKFAAQKLGISRSALYAKLRRAIETGRITPTEVPHRGLDEIWMVTPPSSSAEPVVTSAPAPPAPQRALMPAPVAAPPPALIPAPAVAPAPPLMPATAVASVPVAQPTSRPAPVAQPTVAPPLPATPLPANIPQKATTTREVESPRPPMTPATLPPERVPAEPEASDPPVATQEGALAAIIGVSPEIERVRRDILTVATSTAPVLILGESGVGKELVARAIHALSGRTGKFLAENCGGFSEGLIESELFGHTKGAFTGAALARRGLFERADHGTVFLDEIGEMPLELQKRFLRVLETQKVRAVGGSQTFNVDVRLVAATNQDLEELVRLKQFRRDLYFRMNVVRIEVPPLRVRTGDIEALVRHFLGGRSVTEEALAKLVAHPWPGNVRELKAVLTRVQMFYRSDPIPAEAFQFESAKIVAPSIQAPAVSTPQAEPTELAELRDRLKAAEAEIARLASAPPVPMIAPTTPPCDPKFGPPWPWPPVAPAPVIEKAVDSIKPEEPEKPEEQIKPEIPTLSTDTNRGRIYAHLLANIGKPVPRKALHRHIHTKPKKSTIQANVASVIAGLRRLGHEIDADDETYTLRRSKKR